MFFAMAVTGCGGAEKPAAEETAAETETATEAVTETSTEAAAESGYDLAAGKAVYDANCASCHAAGIMGAPKLGAADDWTARIEQGMETLIQKSIDGYTSEKGYMMPARGGNPDLSDEDIVNSVAYMVEESK